jgi:Ca2+-binding RTX toxin-like protein
MPWFAFTDVSGEAFVFRLTDPARIAEARAILAGSETGAIHIGGTVVKTPLTGNIGWSYHLDPGSIFFFEMSTEVGDSTMTYIEQHLAAVGGALLPGSVWTGWSSELLSELHVMRGGTGAEAIAGDAGADLIFGHAGGDTLSGRGGADHLAGGTGADRLHGGSGADRLDGGSGNDTLAGGAGDDLLFAGRGSNRLRGGDGADIFRFGDPTGLGQTVVADFVQGSDRLDLDRAWLQGLADSDSDGRLTRHDVIAAFAQAGPDLVLTHVSGAELVLEGLAGAGLKPADFWLY